MSEHVSPPMEWKQFSNTLLKGRYEGANPVDLPDSFLMAAGMLEVFDEVFPISKDIFGIRQVVHRAQIAAGVRDVGVETGRIIITDPTGSKFLVQNYNSGESEHTLNSVRWKSANKPGQIGDIHLHPLSSKKEIEGLPSTIDLIPILTGKMVTRMIVATNEVTVLVRSSESIYLPVPEVAKGYLIGMGRQKRKIFPVDDQLLSFLPQGLLHELLEDNGWMVDMESLKELRVAAYQSVRGKKHFLRKA